MVSTLPAVLVASLAVYLLVKVYKILTNPLNVVPGPWYARFTELPSTVATLRKQQVQYYHALHQKYGPYVRVAPDKVFISDVDTFKAIHKVGSNFKKSDYYHYFGPTDAGKPPYGLFQMTNTNDHAQRRKLLGRGFTVSSLRADWEELVREKASTAIEAMARDAEISNGEVDIRKWWMFMASDIVSRLMFGQSFDALKTGKEDPWFEELNISIVAAFSALSFPRIYEVAKRLPIIGGLRLFSSYKALIDKGRVAVENSKETTRLQTANIFAKVMSQAEKDEGHLTNEEICVEAASFMVAGSDTTSNTLTYVIWAVLSRPELQKVLERELLGIGERYNDADLEKLPILHAVLEETLRLYGAVPTPLPRIVPPGGSQLGGYQFPAGTTVATQSWTLHRDPLIFTDPDIFDHTRWLPGGECTKSETARAVFTPFGTGSRVCIGKHLAYLELRYGVAMFFRRFSGSQLSPATTPESMEIDNLVLIEPRGKACRVILP